MYPMGDPLYLAHHVWDVGVTVHDSVSPGIYPAVKTILGMIVGSDS